MKPEEVQALYDPAYAQAYDEKFLHSKVDQTRTREFARMLSGHLGSVEEGKAWLDLGCGTGYFLSQFPKHMRAGLDLSPAMLDIARQRNPGTDFTQGSFTEAHPEWENQWDVITCMWYAYGLLDDLAQIKTLLHNLARWCKPGGLVFLHYADPRLIGGAQFPDSIQHPQGLIQIDGILWSFVEAGDKVHVSQLAPTLDWIRRNSRPFFGSMEVVQHAPAAPELLEQVDLEWAKAVQAEEVIIFRNPL